MINSNYSKAYSEVLEIISVLPKSEYNKIPVKYIEYLEENADRSEGFKYNIENLDIKKGEARCISNIILENEANLSIKSGSLLCVIKEN